MGRQIILPFHTLGQQLFFETFVKRKHCQGRPSGSSIENLDLDRDVLGSLEKLQRSHSTMGQGTIRSIRSNGSIPTLERVKREESVQSIGSHSQTSSGQVSIILWRTMILSGEVSASCDHNNETLESQQCSTFDNCWDVFFSKLTHFCLLDCVWSLTTNWD